MHVGCYRNIRAERSKNHHRTFLQWFRFGAKGIHHGKRAGQLLTRHTADGRV